MSEQHIPRGSNVPNDDRLLGSAPANSRIPGLRSPLVHVKDGQTSRFFDGSSQNSLRSATGAVMTPEMMGTLILAMLVTLIEIRIRRREHRHRKHP